LLGLTDLLAKDVRHESKQLAEYQEYIKALASKNEAQALSHVDFATHLDIMSGIDEINYSAPSRKKEFILSVSDQEEKFAIGILKKSLYDSDAEVKHYAATMLAAIEEDYEKKIYDLKEHAGRDAEAALDLIVIYDRYIHSGILAESTKKVLLPEFMALLSKGKTMFADNDEILVKLFNTYLELHKLDQAKELLPELEQRFRGQAFPFILGMRLHYCLKNYEKVAENAVKIKERDLEIPAAYKQVVNYWSQERGLPWRSR